MSGSGPEAECNRLGGPHCWGEAPVPALCCRCTATHELSLRHGAIIAFAQPPGGYEAHVP